MRRFELASALFGVTMASGQTLFDVTIQTMDGKRIPLQVCSTSTIFDIKRQIEEEEGIAAGRQRLLYAGKTLDDPSYFGCAPGGKKEKGKAYGLGSGVTIYLMVRAEEVPSSLPLSGAAAAKAPGSGGGAAAGGAAAGGISLVAVRPLMLEDLKDADRIMRLAFGTFLNMPDPSSFMGDAD